MKLISLNVEGDKHWDRIGPFLDKEQADTICFQEIFEEDAVACAARLGMEYIFRPMVTDIRHDGAVAKFGVAILSRLPMSDIRSEDYFSPSSELRSHDRTARRENIRQSVISASVQSSEGPIVVATTHFTWTSNGLSDIDQETDAESLLKILSRLPEVILCGDFNMPRGLNQLYERFTARYADAIPASYVSSLDLDIHRKGHDLVEGQHLARYMVDYFFVSKGYSASDVHLESGVSDHKAVVGNIAPRGAGAN
jgi:endonuclease/exonuclease/phosphatase family metal-dependent hydrolase